jgi:hypothetical protein
VKTRISTKPRERTLAPGLLDQHYSPHTSLTLVARAPRGVEPRTGVIYWRRPKGLPPARNIFVLTRRGAADDAARSLYAVLRAADAEHFAGLICEKAPARAGAWGEAINDRLQRAAGKRHAAR